MTAGWPPAAKAPGAAGCASTAALYIFMIVLLWQCLALGRPSTQHYSWRGLVWSALSCFSEGIQGTIHQALFYSQQGPSLYTCWSYVWGKVMSPCRLALLRSRLHARQAFCLSMLVVLFSSEALRLPHLNRLLLLPLCSTRCCAISAPASLTSPSQRGPSREWPLTAAAARCWQTTWVSQMQAVLGGERASKQTYGCDAAVFCGAWSG
jgi:hypothetical protein